MCKIISFMHVSLDGFVAGPNGEMNWINVNQEIFDRVHQRIRDTDAAMYGRKTFEMMEGYWPEAGKKPDASKHDIEHSAWYAMAHKFVLSRSMKGQESANTTIISDDLPDRINSIRNQEGSEILVFGSPTATHALMQLGLIDGFWLFVNPIVLGRGIPLFQDVQVPLALNLESTRAFSCGVVEMSFGVKN